MNKLTQEQMQSISKAKVHRIVPPKSRFKIELPRVDPKLVISSEQAKSILDRDSRFADLSGGIARTTTYFGYPLLQEQSPRVMARKILSHNQFKQFTAVSNIGKSGGGKTTSSQGLVHHLHDLANTEFGVQFHVRWVGKEELLDFEKFIRSCAHTNTIFVFEDISYALEIVPKKQKVKIKEAFTHIRHELKDVQIICIFHYHYTRALDKMMRDSYYTIYTTLGHEEKGNILHIHGTDSNIKEMLNKFQYRSMTQDEKGYFTIPLDAQNEEKFYIYWTQNPFQIALTNQHDKWHFMLYASPKNIPEICCKLCVPIPEKYIGDLTPQYLIDTMQREFGKGRANLILRWFCFMRGGKDCLNKYDRKVWVWLENFLQHHSMDFDAVIPLVHGEIRWGKYKQFHSITKKKSEKITKDVLSKSKPWVQKRIGNAMESMFAPPTAL